MSHRERRPPRARPRAPPLPLASRPAARAGIGWAAPGGGARRRRGGGGGEACEQSVIGGCPGRRRKRELGIAAPSPFPYFLSPGPRPRRAGEGPRAPPPTARQCAPGRCRLRRRPPLPPPPTPPPSRGSLRNRQRGQASLPPLAEAGAGSLGDEELPGLHPLAAQPRASLRLTAGGGAAGSPRKPDRRPPPGSGRAPSPGRSAHSAGPRGGTSAHPRFPPAGAAPPTLAASGGSPPLPRRPRQPRLGGAPRRAAPTGTGLQTRGPTAPASTHARARPPRLAALAPPPSCRAPKAGHPAPLPGVNPWAATCLRLGWESPSRRRAAGVPRTPGARGAPRASHPPASGHPPRDAGRPLPPAPG